MVEIHEYAGLRRTFDVGLRIAPSAASAAVAAKSLAGILDEHAEVGARLVDVDSDGGRVSIIIAVCLGTVDEVKAAAAPARAALALLQRIVDDLAGYDPAFVQLPVAPRVVRGDRAEARVPALQSLAVVD